MGWGPLQRPMAVNVGNPHLVFFVDDVAGVDLGRVGPSIEHDPAFPERINVNVAQVTGPNALQLRTWERNFALGTEYYLKVGYAAALQKALDAGGDNEPKVDVWLDYEQSMIPVRIRLTDPSGRVVDQLMDKRG